jgi:IclR family transcriptional regulator, mhp operon transcriptional activator
MGHYRPVRALERGLAVLKAANTLVKPTVEAIARETSLSWSTTLRMLETLEAAGYVSRHDTDRTFQPTLHARSLGEGTVQSTWITQIASPHIGRLSRKLIWPIDLMVFNADAMLIVETTHRASPLSIDRNMIGRRLPVLMTSAGRCYLGHLPSRVQRSTLARLARKRDQEGQLVRQRKVIDQLMKQVRADGFGTREGGLFPHTKSIAVPINANGEIAACMSIIWIASALTLAEAVKRFLPDLRKTASDISHTIAEKSDR